MVRNITDGMMSELEVAIEKAERQDWIITDIFDQISQSGDSLKDNQKIILIYWLLFPGLSPDFLSEIMRTEKVLYHQESTIRNYLTDRIIPVLKNLIVKVKPELSQKISINRQELWFLLQTSFCKPISLEKAKHRYWLLLGLAESLKQGSPLYGGIYPVAIDPPHIPIIGAEVVITSQRFLRASPPLQTMEGDFQLQEVTGELPPLSKVVILKLMNFVDPTSAERRERVWAAIKWIN